MTAEDPFIFHAKTVEVVRPIQHLSCNFRSILKTVVTKSHLNLSSYILIPACSLCDRVFEKTSHSNVLPTQQLSSITVSTITYHYLWSALLPAARRPRSPVSSFFQTRTNITHKAQLVKRFAKATATPTAIYPRVYFFPSPRGARRRVHYTRAMVCAICDCRL